LLTESLLLAFLGGALGILVAHLGLAALLTLAPENLPRATEIAVDGRVLGFTLALTLLTGLGFGLVPALQASQVQLHDTLKQAGRGASDGKNRRWLRGALVVGELATALVLLAGAGLLVRSFLQLYAVNPGFNPQDAVVAGFRG
jgi:TRAP-type C4-dicarboxylate transport system permease small subunit